MKKSTKKVKKLLALFLVVLISIDSYAALISDNDGSAFVTKGEFDSLKKSFAEQIDSYHASINSKIDGAIAAYLAGIKTQSKKTIKTGFDIVGEEKTIKFYGKNNIYANSNLDARTTSTIFCLVASGYSNNDFWLEDMQHAAAIRGRFTAGNDTNAIFDIDNNYIKGIFNNAKVNMNISGAGYGASSEIFHYGGLWASLKVQVNQLTLAQLNGNYSKTTWPYTITTTAYGFENYANHRSASQKSWTNHSDTIGYRGDTGNSCVWWSDAVDSTAITACGNATINCSWSYTSEDAMNLHWPWGSTKTMKTKHVIYDTNGNVQENTHYTWSSGKTYTTSTIINSRTGSAFNLNRPEYVVGLWPFTVETITGYVPYLNSQSQDISNFKYYNLHNINNRDEKVANGFFVISNDDGVEGQLELTLKSDINNTYVYFSKSNFDGSIDTSKYLDLEVEDVSSGTKSVGKVAHLVSNTSNYKVKVSFEADARQIYIAVAGPSNNVDDFEINLTQIGDAIVEA